MPGAVPSVSTAVMFTTVARILHCMGATGRGLFEVSGSGGGTDADRSSLWRISWLHEKEDHTVHMHTIATANVTNRLVSA
jgi:hypothetical protein